MSEAQAAAPAASEAPAVEQAAPTAETQAPAPVSPSEAEVRRAVLEERLNKLRSERAERKQSTSHEATKAKLEEERKAFESERSKWKEVSKNPIEALKSLGVAPEQLYQQLTDLLLEESTPEAKQRQVLRALQEQIEQAKENPKLSEVEKELKELREWRAAREKQEEEWRAQAQKHHASQQQQARETQMLHTLKQPEFSSIVETYGEEYALSAAYQVAEMLQKSGQPGDFVSIAKKMKEIDDNFWYTKGKERLSKLSPPSTSEREQKQEQREAAQEPANIGNNIASRVASGNERKLSRKERLQEATKLAEGLTLTSGPLTHQG